MARTIKDEAPLCFRATLRLGALVALGAAMGLVSWGCELLPRSSAEPTASGLPTLPVPSRPAGKPSPSMEVPPPIR